MAFRRPLKLHRLSRAGRVGSNPGWAISDYALDVLGQEDGSWYLDQPAASSYGEVGHDADDWLSRHRLCLTRFGSLQEALDAVVAVAAIEQPPAREPAAHLTRVRAGVYRSTDRSFTVTDTPKTDPDDERWRVAWTDERGRWDLPRRFVTLREAAVFIAYKQARQAHLADLRRRNAEAQALRV